MHAPKSHALSSVVQPSQPEPSSLQVRTPHSSLWSASPLLQLASLGLHVRVSGASGQCNRGHVGSVFTGTERGDYQGVEGFVLEGRKLTNIVLPVDQAPGALRAPGASTNRECAVRECAQ